MSIIKRKEKTLKKLVIIMLIINMCFGNFAFLGLGINESLAASSRLGAEEAKTQDDDIEFSGYFLGEGEDKSYEAVLDVRKENLFYISLNVKNGGYLKNAKIAMESKTDSSSINFEISDLNDDKKIVKNLDWEKQEILCNSIYAGDDVSIGVKLAPVYADNIKLSDLQNTNCAILTGTYVNRNGKEVQIKKEIAFRITWDASTELSCVFENNYYQEFKEEMQEKILLQSTLTLRPLEENNIMPIKKTSIEVNVPKMNNLLPEYVNVVPRETMLTNGKLNFTEENWSFSRETGILTILLNNNPDDENRIYAPYGDDIKDMFDFTFVYSKESETEDAMQIKAKVITENYTNIEEKRKVELNVNSDDIIKTDKSLIDIEYEIKEKTLSKGPIYASFENKEIQPEINSKLTIKVPYAKIINGGKVENIEQTLIRHEEEIETIQGNASIEVTKTTFNKQRLLDLVGDNGNLKIFDKEKNLISTIGKDTETDSNGNVQIVYDEPKNIIIEISKPVKDGYLEIYNESKIINNGETEIEMVKKANILKSKAVAVAKISGDEAYEEKQSSKTDVVELQEPFTKAELEINRSNLSTAVVNKNIEFTVKLRTDDVKYDLYKNPIITLEFPEQIKEVVLKKVDVLFSEELKIKDSNVEKAANGKVLLKITLEGNQTDYTLTEVAQGINVRIIADINVDRLAITSNEKITLTYQNEKAVQYENGENIGTRRTRSKNCCTNRNNYIK